MTSATCDKIQSSRILNLLDPAAPETNHASSSLPLQAQQQPRRGGRPGRPRRDAHVGPGGGDVAVPADAAPCLASASASRSRFVILSRSSLHLLMALKFVATPSSKILVLKQLALALADDLWSIFGQFIAPNSWRYTISIHALSSQFSVQQSSSTKLIEFVGAADVEVREASAVAGGRGGFRWRWCCLPFAMLAALK